MLSCIHVQLLVAGIKLCTSHGHTPCVYLGERCLYSHVCKDHSQGEGPDHNDSSIAVSLGPYSSAYVVHAGNLMFTRLSYA